MKNYQFDLFKRIFSRRSYKTHIFYLNFPASLYGIFIKNKAQFITEHFTHEEHKIFVYNGKQFRRCKVSLERVGHRFGEFIRTKKQSRIIHKSDRNTKRAQKIFMKAHGMLKKQRRTK